MLIQAHEERAVNACVSPSMVTATRGVALVIGEVQNQAGPQEAVGLGIV